MNNDFDQIEFDSVSRSSHSRSSNDYSAFSDSTGDNNINNDDDIDFVVSHLANELGKELHVDSAMPNTGISPTPLDNFEPTGRRPDNDSAVHNVAFGIGLDVKANTNNTIYRLASVMPKKTDRLSDITSKKQSSSRKHGSSSSSSKKSLSDSNEDYDNSENINNNKRLTWKQLSELRSFKNLQGVHSLQQCFANAFGYTDGLDGTTMTPVPDGISKRFKRHLTAHYDDLANNGNISKMFERLRKQEGDTYQAVSDKWDATRALVRGLVPPPDKQIIDLLWKLDGTGKYEYTLIDKLVHLDDRGSVIINLIPENAKAFSRLISMYRKLTGAITLESVDDSVPVSPAVESALASSESMAGSDLDDDPKPNSGENKKINHDDDVPSRKSSNHGLTQQQLLTDENFKNLPDENLKKAFANAFGFQYGGQSDVPGDKDILDQFRTLFANNYIKYVTSGTYDRIIALFELLQRQAGDTYSEIQDKLIAIYNLLRANKFTDSRFIRDFWRWNISDPNDDLLVKNFWHSDRGWCVLPNAYMNYMIKNLHDCVLRRRLMEIIPQNLKGVSWEDLLRDDDLNSLPQDLRNLFYGAFHFSPDGYYFNNSSSLRPALRSQLSSLSGFCVGHALWTPISNLCIRLRDSDDERFIEFCDKLSSVEFLSEGFGNNLDEDFISAFWMWNPFPLDDSIDDSLAEYYRDDPETGEPSIGKTYIDFLIDDHSDLEIVQSLQNMVDSLQQNSEEEKEKEALTEVTWENLSTNEHWQQLPERLKAIFRKAFGFSEDGEPKDYDSNEILKRFRSAFAANYMSYNKKYSERIKSLLRLLVDATGDPYIEIDNKSYLTDALIEKFGNPDEGFMTAFWTWDVLDPNNDAIISHYYHEEDTPGKACLDFVLETLRDSDTDLENQLNRAVGIGNAEEENANDEDVDN